MSICNDELSRPLNPRPGPRGLPGAPGANSTVPGPSGKNAFTTTTAAFTQPAIGANVVVSVVDSSFVALGQSLFVEAAGYYLVITVPSPTSITLQRQNITGAFVSTGAPVASGSKVTPSGFAVIDNTQYNNLNTRVTALEGDPGFESFYSATAPTGTFTIGSIWFDTANNYRMYRWDGTGWVLVEGTIGLGDFGVGIRPVSIVNVLPVGDAGNLQIVFLTTDSKLYRWTGTAWTAAISGTDITGTIDGTQLAANSIVAGKIAAGAIQAAAIGANQIITVAANIADAVIIDAKIANLAVSKLLAGTITAQIFTIAGGASGAIRSSGYSAGVSGWNIDGAGNAEFNAVTVRGTLQAGKIGNDSSIFNPGTPANLMASVTFQNWQDGTNRTSLGAGGTTVWLGSFYGWAHGSGTPTNRFGKSTMLFDCIANGGCSPNTSSWVDLEIVYRVNGGSTTQVNPFAMRATFGNGSLNVSGGVQISGLGATDQVDFGFRAKSTDALSQLNVVNLTVKAYNF